MSNPLSRLEHLLRVQMPGAPSGDIAGAVEDILALAGGGIGTAVEAVASPAVAPVEASIRLSAVEAAIESLKTDIAATIASLKADIAAAHTATTEDPTVTQRLDAIDRAMVALQGSISKLEAAPAPTAVATDTADAIHKRLAALEARPAAAPARAAAPAARPAASA